MKAMRLLGLLPVILVLASPLRGQQETPPAPSPSPGPAESAAAPAAPNDAQEMLRLKEAGYSEEFLLNKIHRENRTYVLSTDDLVLLHKAGLSETVIDAMLKSGNTSATGSSSMAAPSPAPAPAAAPAVSATPPAAPPPAAAVAAPAVQAQAEDLSAVSTSFDGLVRQKRGFLIFGGSKKKAIGKLVVDKEQVHWYQAVDPEDNFSMFTKNIKEMWLSCAPRAGENLCLELCFKTYSGDEWCFRDTGWENGTNQQITAVFEFFQKTFPATFFSKREKKSF